ncbi:hypothetical protein TVAG_018240 [Trichomonas vaginalis G3]|uniref:Uncharacterized protein n=1 Tax=Trichomonas vaginalis (strain ATCC PRA-98 / G3) TaxID=412133 RepID=A2F9W0_TRIV3|nr:hypothetical protein TVAGG3_0506730 [Trichomonas vaginalis G3]EAX98288.1 hypothetical protein TVAG_018240 [Trichomonas vaginalis G3]KAI5517482.1 hypothetical protein TVAGG3_0506730 [Trichomonas vaginalis G3]|eukprot:XP_001311218.1 hypothetical protein [Trichomonas vaginalis G3]
MEEFERSQSIEIPRGQTDFFSKRINQYEENYINMLTGPNDHLDCLHYLFEDIQSSLQKAYKIKAELEAIKFDPKISEEYRIEAIKKNRKEQIDKFNKMPEAITDAVKNNNFYQANYIYEKSMNFAEECGKYDRRINFKFDRRDLNYYYIHAVNMMQTPGQSIFFYTSIAQFLRSITKQENLLKYADSVFPMFKLSLERMFEDPLFTQLKVDTVEEASRQLTVIFEHATKLYPELNPMKERYINDFINNVKNYLGGSIIDKVQTIEKKLGKSGDLSSYVITSYLLNESKIDFSSPIIDEYNISNFISICVHNPNIWHSINKDSPSDRFNQYCARLKELADHKWKENADFSVTFRNQIKSAKKSKFNTIAEISSKKLDYEVVVNEYMDFRPFFKEMSDEALMIKILSKIAKFSYLADASDWENRRNIFYEVAEKFKIRKRALLPALRTLDISFKQQTPEDAKKKKK